VKLLTEEKQTNIANSHKLHRAIAEARARGESSEVISTKFDWSKEALQELFKQPNFVELVLDIQTINEIPIETRIQNTAIAAYERQYQLMMTSEDSRVSSGIANSLLDRALGKATQRSENINLTFSAGVDIKSLDGSMKAVQDRIGKFEAERDKIMADMKQAEAAG
jgi:hypothetical protein